LHAYILDPLCVHNSAQREYLLHAKAPADWDAMPHGAPSKDFAMQRDEGVGVTSRLASVLGCVTHSSSEMGPAGYMFVFTCRSVGARALAASRHGREYQGETKHNEEEDHRRDVERPYARALGELQNVDASSRIRNMNDAPTRVSNAGWLLLPCP
jgi:hypothetical protein